MFRGQLDRTAAQHITLRGGLALRKAWGIPVSYVGKVTLHDSKGGSGRPKLYDALAVETSKTDVFKSIQGIFINGMGDYIVFELAAKRADGALYTYQPVRVNL